MSYFDEVLNYLIDRKNRALSGLYNCIPWPFPRFRLIFPGTQMCRYIICTANQKIGKTKFCDFVYVYEAIDFIIKHPEVRLKVLYFCLEESPKKKYIEFLCHLLYRLDKLIVTNADIESTDKDKPISDDILNLLKTERYQEYIRKFNEVVEYIDDVRNPTGINKKCREYALANGHLNFKTVQMPNPVTGKMEDRSIVDPVNPYTPNDSEEYRIIILDNSSNLVQESGLNKRETIEKMSKYFITLRDQLKYTIVMIQHQALRLHNSKLFIIFVLK